MTTEKKSAELTEVEHKRKNQRLFLGAYAVPTGIIDAALVVVKVVLFAYALQRAYSIRTYALTEFGYVIHEFDPWFNYRATEYLSNAIDRYGLAGGWEKFFHWFDYESWYPLGRPVGTTIYPGLQLTAVAIHRALAHFGVHMSLNDVCCTIPCWFGAVATAFLALLTWEATASSGAAVLSALIFGIIPAHMMRSVGGGFDNECIAISAIVATFYFWVRSLRTSYSWPFGIATGLAYGYMVAAWGGFIFVLNMVAFHAAATIVRDILNNRYQRRLHISYSLFYIIGTFIATRVPPVGMMPFKSLEQLFALLVFVVLNVLALTESRRRELRMQVLSRECMNLRLKYLGGVALVATVVAAFIVPEGFFGPLSSRVRALFLQHTRTGNPLVDSVAEHQPASPDAYWQYLHLCSMGWQVGMFSMWYLVEHRHNAALFLSLYGFVSYFFSLKMARLIILSGPVASAMTAYCVAAILRWTREQLWWSEHDAEISRKSAERLALMSDPKTRNQAKKGGGGEEKIDSLLDGLKLQYHGARNVRVVAAFIVVGCIVFNVHWGAFERHCERLAHGFANPQIMFKSQGQDGRVQIIDDYRQAYFWLRDNTPEDSRVLSWWDYGYQITGIGNRTTLADGNTWNHEHIATIGYMLTSPVPRAHSLIKYVADYVLVWAGHGGDDLAKSPHMARIGNSVYRDICPRDPLCMHFGFEGGRDDYSKPTKMMRESLLYNIVSHNLRPGVRVDPNLFTEAYTSKHGLVRIFKVVGVSEETKKWLADPKNRDCDAPGSWYCTGRYPDVPEWNALLAKRRDFSQPEDFNKKGKKDDTYHDAYMSRMARSG